MTYFYRRYPRGQRGNGIGLKGVFRNIFSKSNLKKGAQKLLKFGSDVLKEHNSNPGMSLLDATKKTAKDQITRGFKNIVQQKAIKPLTNRVGSSSPLKRKAKAPKYKLKHPKYPDFKGFNKSYKKPPKIPKFAKTSKFTL